MPLGTALFVASLSLVPSSSLLCPQIGYGTLLGNRWTTPSKGFNFSSKLTRAEALAMFRKRFQVPLEWEELVTDPSAQPTEAGRPMTRSALHHLIWVVRVGAQRAGSQALDAALPWGLPPSPHNSPGPPPPPPCNSFYLRSLWPCACCAIGVDPVPAPTPSYPPYPLHRFLWRR